MRKKFIDKLFIFLIVICIGSLLCACDDENQEEYENVEFSLSNKAIDYFDKNPDGKHLLLYVDSYTELNDILVKNNFLIDPQYDEQFFDTKDLIIWCFTSPIYNDLQIQLMSKDDKLFIKKTYITIGGVALEALRQWAFLIEIDKTDIGEIIII